MARADETSLTLTTTSGSSPASVTTFSYTSANAAFSVIDAAAPVSVSVTVQPSQPAPTCKVTLRRAYEAPLSTGVFRAPGAPLPPVPCMLDLEWGGFWILSNQLEIGEVAFDANGRLAALACTFTAFALGSSSSVRGELKFHAGAGVAPVNQRPGVTAGNAQRSAIQSNVSLAGAAGDDGLPRGTALETRWSVVRGPGTVTFADATGPATTASFAVAGRYLLQLTADDSEYSVERQVGVSIFDPTERTRLSTAFGYFGSDHRFSSGSNKTSPDEVDIVATGTASSGLTIDTHLNPEPINFPSRFLEFLPAPGTALVAGVYEVGPPPANSPAARPSLFKYGSEAVEGRVEVKELSFAADGSVNTLWLLYEARLGALPTDWQIGEIRVRASAAADVHQPLRVRGIVSATKVQRDEPVWLGSITFDDRIKPPPITKSWSQVSGPGTAIITDDGDSRVKALFPSPGIYVLRVTVMRETEVVTSDLTIEQEDRHTSINVKAMSNGGSPDQAYFYNLDSGLAMTASSSVGGDEIRISSGGSSFVFTKVRGGRLQAGDQLSLASGSGQNAGRVSMSNIPQTSYLGSLAGDLWIHEATWNSSGMLESFHATFLQTGSRLEGQPQARVTHRIRGEVRWRVTLPSPPVNLAPEVGDGEKLIAWTPSGKDALLELSADDDVLPPRQPLTYQWEMVSGPAPVTFQSPNRPRTQAHFSAPGNYRLRLEASDGELSGSNEMRVTVGSALMSGRYSGLLIVEGVGAGLAKVTLNANGRFSGSLRIGGTTLPFSGTFQGSLWQKTWPLVGGGTLRLTINRAADGLSLLGKISDGETTFDFTLTQTAHEMLVKDGLPTIPAGIHNFILGSSEMPGAPAGHGFGKITLSKTGTARIAGSLADGTAFSFSGDVQAGNTIAMWVPLYSARGELAGSVNLGEEWFASGLIWLRPEHRGKRYPEGFGVPLYLAASPYHAPKRGNGVLTLDATPATGTLDLFAEADAAPRNYTFTLGAIHRFALDPNDGPVLSVAPSTGLFTGRFVDRAKRTRTIRGVMLQGIGIGGGYFLDETQSRAVQIESSQGR